MAFYFKLKLNLQNFLQSSSAVFLKKFQITRSEYSHELGINILILNTRWKYKMHISLKTESWIILYIRKVLSNVIFITEQTPL